MGRFCQEVPEHHAIEKLIRFAPPCWHWRNNQLARAEIWYECPQTIQLSRSRWVLRTAGMGASAVVAVNQANGCSGSNLAARSRPRDRPESAHLRHSCTRRQRPLTDPTTAARRRQRSRGQRLRAGKPPEGELDRSEGDEGGQGFGEAGSAWPTCRRNVAQPHFAKRLKGMP
jgi:hypothetical protein